ncbi:MAG: cobalamin-dependent protein [Bacteroidota bacterium]
MRCVASGKINKSSPYPPELQDQDGADELCMAALQEGIAPQDILNKALIVGMSKIGEQFAKGQVFVPEVLIAAKAMNVALKHLRPFFASGQIKRKGVFVVGTVLGDLHDIGKNILAMVIKGAGWEVIDLGTDVSGERFLETIARYPGCVVGLSALLTTTMINMGTIVKEVKRKHPETIMLVGGAPLSHEFCKTIGADFYSPDPHGAVEFLRTHAA